MRTLLLAFTIGCSSPRGITGLALTSMQAEVNGETLRTGAPGSGAWAVAAEDCRMAVSLWAPPVPAGSVVSPTGNRFWIDISANQSPGRAPPEHVAMQWWAQEDAGDVLHQLSHAQTRLYSFEGVVIVALEGRTCEAPTSGPCADDDPASEIDVLVQAIEGANYYGIEPGPVHDELGRPLCRAIP